MNVTIFIGVLSLVLSAIALGVMIGGGMKK
jgi:hypothetical protein